MMHGRLYMKINTAVRYGMVYFLSGRLPLYIVNEYPKSGGNWVGLMLERALGVPFPRNRLPVLRPSIMLGHYLSPWNMKNVVVVWRDGRDVMVSMYHHSLFKNELDAPTMVDIFRKDLPFRDYENVRENLPTFIEHFFTKQRSPRFSWADFVRRWYGRSGVSQVRYEDLYQDTVGELQRVVLELAGKQLDSRKAAAIVEEFSFNRLSAGRQPGQESKNSFFRKGIVGDWRNYFSREACQVFDRFAGNELILLGYERDRAWVKGAEKEQQGAQM